ncbi:BT4734/BF3469 family protein [Spirosoma aureum]|uniref:BT4734/BF3469 family protein n=1 Tax=Spirosoma aureum TaxID=2692134 RepID=UPI001E34E412|nr:BT4734/BF3469 family protein [Spirosoma aureum]
MTPSGDFEYRSASKLKPNGHSGLIQFDIDLKDNPHIRNYADLKAQIAKLPFVAYCGLSVSGTGYWGLVPIAFPERHGQHFDALKRVFAHYKINLDDKPRNVASLRGYSYDPAGYFSSQVMLFELYDEPKPQPARSFDYSRFQDQDDSALISRIVRYAESASEGNRHATLFSASRLAGGYIAAGRLDEQTVVYALETIASEWPMHSKSQKTIRDGIRYGQTAPIYPEERTIPLTIHKKTCTPPAYKTYKRTPPPRPRLRFNPEEGELLDVVIPDSSPWDDHKRGEGTSTYSLVDSPNREEFARLLSIAPDQLPLYQFNSKSTQA